MATVTAIKARAAATTQLGKQRAQLSQMQTFTWVGLDKRGVKIKGEQVSKNANLVKADLRKQGINPQVGHAERQAVVRQDRQHDQGPRHRDLRSPDSRR